MTSYVTLLAQLYARPPQPSQAGLERMRALLEALDNPHRDVPCVVVAGTNGKGSTSALIAGALKEAGHKVGLFTSPHLLTYRERIRIGKAMISCADVVEGLEHILRVAQSHTLVPTFFEVTTALALWHFQRSCVDVAVLEVGLGGRLDATNAARKVLCVLTPISMDHEAMLGTTLTAIAREKAAILEAGVPAVAAPQRPEARAVIEERLRALGSSAHWSAQDEAQARAGASEMPPYQQQNFACAEAACAVLDAQTHLRCPPEAFAEARRHFSWPGRYQWLWPQTSGARHLACPIVLDGGHNPAGAEALAEAIATDPRMHGRRLHVIFAVVAGKDCDAMLRALRPLAASWRICGLKSKRRRSPAQLAAQIGMGARAFDDFEAAWQDVAACPPDAEDRILVCGSLFLVADALASLTHAPRDPAIDG